METIFMYVITIVGAAVLGVNAQVEAKSHKSKEHKEKSHHEKKSRKHDKKHGKEKEITPAPAQIQEEPKAPAPTPEVKIEENVPIGGGIAK